MIIEDFLFFEMLSLCIINSQLAGCDIRLGLTFPIELVECRGIEPRFSEQLAKLFGLACTTPHILSRRGELNSRLSIGNAL